MSFKIIDRDFGFNAAVAKMKQLDSAEGTIGVHSDEPSRINHLGKSVAAGFIASQMEFGGFTEKFKDGRPIRYPSRPFLRETYDNNFKLWAGRLTIAAREALGGKPVRASLQLASDKFAKAVRVKLIRGPWKPNSIRTKRFKSPGKPPLIDSGKLRKSIKAKVTVTL